MKLDGIKLYHDNGVYMGDVYQEVDGFYVFWPNKELTGFWGEEDMYEVYKLLRDKNKPWQDEIDRYFNEQTRSD